MSAPTGAPTNVKAVSAINRASAKEEVPTEEAEALVAALDACNKTDAALSAALLPHVRQRGLVYLPAAITCTPANESALAGKALLALANTLANPASNDVLRAAAVDALAGIALQCKEKQAEVTREVADILLQISLGDSGFSAELQKKAREYVTKGLVEACPRGVVAKMLHWLSDDREDDAQAQIDAERELAFQILESGALRKPNALTALQADEAIPKIAARVLSAVSAEQFQRLLPTVMQYLGAHEASLVAVIDGVIGAKFDTPRSWEAMAILARSLPRASAFAAAATGGAVPVGAAAAASASTAATEVAAEGAAPAAASGSDAAPAPAPAPKAAFHCDSPLEKIAAVLNKKNALDSSDVLALLKAYAASAAVAGADAAAKKAQLGKDVLSKVMSHAQLAGNFTAVEAALLALASVAARDEEAAKANIDDALAASLKQFDAETVTPALQLYTFAFKKEGKAAAPRCATTVLACLENIKQLCGKLADKHAAGAALPPASWLGVFRGGAAAKGGKGQQFGKALEAAIRPRGN